MRLQSCLVNHMSLCLLFRKKGVFLGQSLKGASTCVGRNSVPTRGLFETCFHHSPIPSTQKVLQKSGFWNFTLLKTFHSLQRWIFLRFQRHVNFAFLNMSRNIRGKNENCKMMNEYILYAYYMLSFICLSLHSSGTQIRIQCKYL